MTFKNFVDRSLPVVDAAWLNAVDRKLYDVVSVFDFMTAAQIADVRAGTLLVDVSAAVGAGYTLSAAGATGTPEDGGIYAEVL
jgi:hypothetical protein